MVTNSNDKHYLNFKLNHKSMWWEFFLNFYHFNWNLGAEAMPATIDYILIGQIEKKEEMLAQLCLIWSKMKKKKVMEDDQI